MNRRPAVRRLSSLSMLLLTACVPQFPAPPPAGFAPDRSAFAALPEADRVLHAEAVVNALEGSAHRPVAWAGVADGVGGSVAVTETVRFKTGLVCRRLSDTLDTGAGARTVNDAACWSGGQWVWLRTGEPQQPVLADAAWPADKTYTVRSGGTLGAIARRLDLPEAELARLNPTATGRLRAGTVVRLP